jgi:hypothetical protein
MSELQTSSDEDTTVTAFFGPVRLDEGAGRWRAKWTAAAIFGVVVLLTVVILGAR